MQLNIPVYSEGATGADGSVKGASPIDVCSNASLTPSGPA